MTDISTPNPPAETIDKYLSINPLQRRSVAFTIFLVIYLIWVAFLVWIYFQSK